MWPDFTMTGGYDLKGIEGFMGAMDYLVATYDKTMHLNSWDSRDIEGYINTKIFYRINLHNTGQSVFLFLYKTCY